jgi:hypothetical protein
VLLQIPVPDGGAECGALPTISNVKASSLAACAAFATGAATYVSGALCSVECAAGYSQVGELICEDGAWTGGFACTTEAVCSRPDAASATCPSFTYTNSSALDVRVAAQLAAAFASDHSYADDCEVVKLAGATSYTLSGVCAAGVKTRYVHVTPGKADLQLVLDFRDQEATVKSVTNAAVVSNAGGLLTLQLPSADSATTRIALELYGSLPRPVIRCAALALLPRVNGVSGAGACQYFLAPAGTTGKATFDASSYGAPRRRRWRRRRRRV